MAQGTDARAPDVVRFSELYTDKRVDDALCCEVCMSPDEAERMLVCDTCNTGWHTKCLRPPLQQLPPDDVPWHCSNCRDAIHQKWAQCTSCNKWRRVPYDAFIPSGTWTCGDNKWDVRHSRCAVAQEASDDTIDRLVQGRMQAPLMAQAKAQLLMPAVYIRAWFPNCTIKSPIPLQMAVEVDGTSSGNQYPVILERKPERRYVVKGLPAAAKPVGCYLRGWRKQANGVVVLVASTADYTKLPMPAILQAPLQPPQPADEPEQPPSPILNPHPELDGSCVMPAVSSHLQLQQQLQQRRQQRLHQQSPQLPTRQAREEQKPVDEDVAADQQPAKRVCRQPLLVDPQDRLQAQHAHHGSIAHGHQLLQQIGDLPVQLVRAQIPEARASTVMPEAVKVEAPAEAPVPQAHINMVVNANPEGICTQLHQVQQQPDTSANNARSAPSQIATPYLPGPPAITTSTPQVNTKLQPSVGTEDTGTAVAGLTHHAGTLPAMPPVMQAFSPCAAGNHGMSASQTHQLSSQATGPNADMLATANARMNTEPSAFNTTVRCTTPLLAVTGLPVTDFHNPDPQNSIPTFETPVPVQTQRLLSSTPEIPSTAVPSSSAAAPLNPTLTATMLHAASAHIPLPGARLHPFLPAGPALLPAPAGPSAPGSNHQAATVQLPASAAHLPASLLDAGPSASNYQAVCNHNPSHTMHVHKPTTQIQTATAQLASQAPYVPAAATQLDAPSIQHQTHLAQHPTTSAHLPVAAFTEHLAPCIQHATDAEHITTSNQLPTAAVEHLTDSTQVSPAGVVHLIHSTQLPAAAGHCFAHATQLPAVAPVHLAHQVPAGDHEHLAQLPEASMAINQHLLNTTQPLSIVDEHRTQPTQLPASAVVHLSASYQVPASSTHFSAPPATLSAPVPATAAVHESAGAGVLLATAGSQPPGQLPSIAGLRDADLEDALCCAYTDYAVKRAQLSEDKQTQLASKLTLALVNNDLTVFVAAYRVLCQMYMAGSVAGLQGVLEAVITEADSAATAAAADTGNVADVAPVAAAAELPGELPSVTGVVGTRLQDALCCAFCIYATQRAELTAEQQTQLAYKFTFKVLRNDLAAFARVHRLLALHYRAHNAAGLQGVLDGVIRA